MKSGPHDTIYITRQQAQVLLRILYLKRDSIKGSIEFHSQRLNDVGWQIEYSQHYPMSSKIRHYQEKLETIQEDIDNYEKQIQKRNFYFSFWILNKPNLIILLKEVIHYYGQCKIYFANAMPDNPALDGYLWKYENKIVEAHQMREELIFNQK